MSFLLLLLSPALCHAQDWDINIGAGMSSTRLIPLKASTMHTGFLRYSFLGANIYLSPELSITVSERSKFSFSYEYGQCRSGIKFDKAGLVQSYFEVAELHNFNVGYHYRRAAWNGRTETGFFVKGGLAYGYNNGAGESGQGSSSGTTPNTGMGSVTTYAATKKLTEFEVMGSFWMPTATLGFTLRPVTQLPYIADRLELTIAVMAGLKNIYTQYSKLEYSFIDGQTVQHGIAQYQGMPLILQVGGSYRLFRFVHNSY